MSIVLQLADDLIAAQLRLLRVSAGERLRIARLLERVTRELVGLVATTEIGRARQQQLLREAEAIIREEYRKIEASMAATLQSIGSTTAAQTAGIVSASMAGAVTVTAPTETMLRTLVSELLIQGAPSADWWSRQAADTAWRFAGAVRVGVAAGETNQQIIRRVRSEMDVSKRGASALVQTSIQAVANEARRETYRANSDLIRGIRQVSTLDGNTTDICIAYSGGEWELDGTPRPGTTLPYGTGTPRHWNCLPGDTLVTTRGDVTGVSKRRFDGNVVVIRTASGRELTSTPNHPILTGRGWVPSGLLNVGDHVISDGGTEWGGLGNRNSEDVPTAIHDVAEAYLSSRGVVAVPVVFSPEDFHGDGADGKVGIVFSDSFLTDEIYPASHQHFLEKPLIDGLAPTALCLTSPRHFLKPFEFGRDPANGSVSGGGKRLALFGRAVVHAGLLLRAAVSCRNARVPEHTLEEVRGASEALGHAGNPDTGVEQRARRVERDVVTPLHVDGCASGGEPANDGSLSDMEHARQLLGGFTGAMFADQVVDIQVNTFHGEVLNLETVGGWYTAGGIITHNCRSVEVPITATFRELGIDLPEPERTTLASSDGQIAAETTMDAWLSRRSEAQQDAQLGKGRAALWRSGKITLRDLVGGDGRPLTLAELTE